MNTLYERVIDFERTGKWAVVSLAGAWLAADPVSTEFSDRGDKEFETFAEAIEYAQKQARQ